MLKKLVFVLALIMMISIGYCAVSSVTITSPTDDPYYTTNTTPTITATATSSLALLNATIWGNFTGSYAVNASNKTEIVNITAFNIYTDTLPDGYYNWTVEVCNNNNDCTKATHAIVIVDNTAPSIGTARVTNTSTTTDMTGLVNSTLTETNVLDTCWGNIYASNHSQVSTITGTITDTYCLITMTDSDIGTTGQFNVGVNANDSLGNSATEVNSTNWTKTVLYSGWNLIHVDRNTTLEGISDYSGSISSVSYYYNSNHTYVTHVDGTVTNENHTVKDGDAIYVYVNTTVNLLRFWSADILAKNITLVSGWNQIALQNSTTNNLTNICGLTLDNSSHVNMDSTSFVDMGASSGSRYKGHPCALTVGGTVEVPKGYGVWVNVNGTTTMLLSRV